MSDSNSTVPDITDDYNVPLHIGGLFANLAASAMGVLLPILFAYTTFNPRTTSRIHSIIQTARTFGSGVILATAFIHMLPSAFGNLSDPSLPAIFQEEGYTGWAGLIAMIAALLLHLLEFSATQRYFNHAMELKKQKEAQKPGGVHAVKGIDGDEKKIRSNERDSLEEGHGYAVDAAAKSQAADPCVHVGHVHGGEILLVNKNNKTRHQDQHMSHTHTDSSDDSLLGEEDAIEKEKQERRSRQIGTYILELGIALHSVIIGISLGTTVGSEYISLLIALLFHQFFEGVALGGRIASLQFNRKSLSPWLLSAWFAVSTPLGIAIGIGIRATYNGNSVTALIVQGVFDSCSAGILLYTAMVQLMSTELNSNRAFRESSTRHQVKQFVALWLGAAAMAVVGKWA
ncbi:Zinc/iron permease [Dissophora ornata]|nr:high-affinity Zn(2+) transporter zrt1 [Dissophora ornata]KAI8605709.1 Zinc/iron permease [Dissophora ornata]